MESNDRRQHVATKLRQMAANMRVKSAMVQDKSSAAAEAALETIADFKVRFDGYVEFLDNVVIIMKSASTIGEVILTDDGVRAKAKDLIQNCIVDMSRRVNELSNIIDYVSKSDNIVESVAKGAESIKKASDAGDAALEVYISGKKKKTKLSAVPEEDADVESVVVVKAAAARKKMESEILRAQILAGTLLAPSPEYEELVRKLENLGDRELMDLHDSLYKTNH